MPGRFTKRRVQEVVCLARQQLQRILLHVIGVPRFLWRNELRHRVHSLRRSAHRRKVRAFPFGVANPFANGSHGLSLPSPCTLSRACGSRSSRSRVMPASCGAPERQRAVDHLVHGLAEAGLFESHALCQLAEQIDVRSALTQRIDRLLRHLQDRGARRLSPGPSARRTSSPAAGCRRSPSCR